TVEAAGAVEEVEQALVGAAEPLSAVNNKEIPATVNRTAQQSSQKQAPAPVKDFDALDELLDLFPDPVPAAPAAPVQSSPESTDDDQIPFSPPPKPAAWLSQPKQAMPDLPMSETTPATDTAKNSTDS
ncbi:Uncharacterized protein ALO53_05354, partial [Pseudomonas amygdali pv. photiniae]